MRSSFEELLKLRPDGELTGVEVGVYKGDNAVDMLESCPRIKLILVDSYKANDSWFTDETGMPFSEGRTDEFVNKVKERLSKYNDRSHLMVMNSAYAAGKFPENFFDYVYIDGGHDFKNVMMDMLSWLTRVKPGGMLAGHDYNYHEVGDAVYSFLYSQHYELNVKNRDWWIIKEQWTK